MKSTFPGSADKTDAHLLFVVPALLFGRLFQIIEGAQLATQLLALSLEHLFAHFARFAAFGPETDSFELCIRIGLQ